MNGNVLAVALAATAVVVACSGKSADPNQTAKALTKGLSAAVALAEADPQPTLCAERATPTSATAVATEIPIESGTLRLVGDRLGLKLGGDRKVRFAVVGDARGASANVRETIKRLSREWDASDVSLVFALGGMAEREAELVALYELIATPRRALIAAPGDRESVAGLDTAIATLRGRGLPAFATSEVRAVEIGGATIGVLPGVFFEAGLVSGGDGCLHREQDAADLAALLAAAPAPKFWLSYAAPRQEGAAATASDMSAGVHAGEVALAGAVATSGAQLAIHAQIEPSATADKAASLASQATPTAFVSVGALDDISHLGRGNPSGRGLIVSLEPNSIQWSRTLATVTSPQ